jgi:hypothetical protein
MKAFFFRKYLSPQDTITQDQWNDYQKTSERINTIDHKVNSKNGIDELMNVLRKNPRDPKKEIQIITDARKILELNAYTPRLSKSLMHKWAIEDHALPIHYAIIDNDLNVIQTLIDLYGGTIMNKVDGKNNTPLDYAIRYNKFQLIPYLYSWGATAYNDPSSISKLQHLAERYAT